MPIPIIVTGGSTVAGAGADLTTLRNRLAETLGHHGVGTITATAASLEADLLLISTDYQSDQAVPERLDGLYVHVRSGNEAGSSRRVVDGSFDGPLGALRADRPYASGPLQIGDAFEVSVLPGEKYVGAEGLRHILNLSLETLPVLDYVPITVVANQTQYSLAGYPWPIKGVQSVVYPRTDTTGWARVEMPRCWDFVQDADLPILSFRSLPASAGDVIEVGLVRPASSWIRAGGIWADSTAGLVAETDSCLYDAATVVRVARPLALERMALVHPRGSKERADLLAEAETADVRAALGRWYGSFRRDPRQRAGSGSGASVWGTKGLF